jgi:hypothetical protein
MLAEVQSAPPPSRVWNDGCSDDGRRAMIGGTANFGNAASWRPTVRLRVLPSHGTTRW